MEALFPELSDFFWFLSSCAFCRRQEAAAGFRKAAEADFD